MDNSLPSTPVPCAPELRFTIGGPLTLVEPADPRLRHLLEYEETSFRGGGPTGTVSLRVWKKYQSWDHRHHLTIVTGLVPRLAEEGERLGYQIVIDDWRVCGDEHIPDLVFERELGVAARAVANQMIRHPIGQFEVVDECEMLTRVSLAYELFPRAKIVVAVATKRRAWDLWQRLESEVLDEPVGLLTSGSHRRIGRCTVVTYRYLDTVEPSRVQILLLPDAIDLLGHVPQRAIARIRAKLPALRQYAFTYTNCRLSDVEALRIEAVAGRIISSSRPSRRQVRVVMADVWSTPAVRRLWGLDRKRAAYWGNSKRNEKIAATARAIADRSMAALWAMGLLLDHDEHYLATRADSIAVLVESREHGRVLHRLLPGWSMVTSTESCNAARRIITVTASSGFAVPDIEVLIVASGGDALPEMSWLSCPQTDDENHSVLVIDFADDFDAFAEDETKQRIRSYQQVGWTVDARHLHSQNELHATPPVSRQSATILPAVTSPVDTAATPTRSATAGPTPDRDVLGASSQPQAEHPSRDPTNGSRTGKLDVGSTPSPASPTSTGRSTSSGRRSLGQSGDDSCSRLDLLDRDGMKGGHT